MTPSDYVDLAARAMQADGAEVQTAAIGPVQAAAGHRKGFVWQAMSRMHIITAVAPFPQITELDVAGFARDVSTYARARTGAILGAQSGIGAFAVLVGEHVTPEAVAAAQQRPRIEFAVRVQPVVVDVATSAMHTFRGSSIWGWAINGYLRRRLAAQVPALAIISRVDPVN